MLRHIAVHISGNLRLATRHIPHTHFVYFAAEGVGRFRCKAVVIAVANIYCAIIAACRIVVRHTCSVYAVYIYMTSERTYFPGYGYMVPCSVVYGRGAHDVVVAPAHKCRTARSIDIKTFFSCIPRRVIVLFGNDTLAGSGGLYPCFNCEVGMSKVGNVGAGANVVVGSVKIQTIKRVNYSNGRCGVTAAWQCVADNACACAYPRNNTCRTNSGYSRA